MSYTIHAYKVLVSSTKLRQYVQVQVPVQGTTHTTNACQFVVLKYLYYAYELFKFQQITRTTIVAHEHMRCTTIPRTTMRKTLGVTIHILRGSKLTCIQDYKAFKIKHFPQALKLQLTGENDFGLVHSCRRGIIHFPAHKTTLLTLTLRHSNTSKNNMKANSTKAKRHSHYPCHRSNKTCATLQHHKQ